MPVQCAVQARSEKQLISTFADRIAELNPQLISFNGHGFDLPAVSILSGGAVSDMFDILAGTLSDTALEPDLDDLLWCLTDLFYKKCARVQRQLEDNGFLPLVEERQRANFDAFARPGMRRRSRIVERRVCRPAGAPVL